ncbi:MAG: 16S rRNA (cytosine(1402)-N(4))-methyltransferase RsmH [Bacteroidota bacterium]|nr:16S rRNA (cytosine(1402)-N(4))-methyltransferase RsmH [Bacteroidota bacterium]
MSTYHQPVLLSESIEGLNIKPDGTYIDVTFGGGGHSRKILEQLGEKGHLYAFDQDPDALKNAIDDKRFTLINSNFIYIKNWMRFYNAIPVDGILADLGVSSHQFDVPGRGFSIRYSSNLDLRMNPEAKITAADIVNTYTKEDLKSVFQRYGELKNSWKLAEHIAIFREENNIITTDDLKLAIAKCIPKFNDHKYLAQVFQALRIEVNREMEALETLLIKSKDILKPGGRLVVISYHSLEDRPVKNFLKSGNFKGKIEKDFYGNIITDMILTPRKPITPSEEELKINNRARSAKLRIAEKKTK